LAVFSGVECSLNGEISPINCAGVRHRPGMVFWHLKVGCLIHALEQSLMP
jgi:hypothetical protein